MYNLEKIKKKEGKETLITTQTMSQNSGGLIFDQSAFVTDLQEAISVTGPDLGSVIQSFQKELHESIYLYANKKDMVYKFGNNPSRTHPNLAYNFERKQFYILVGTGTDVWVEIENNLNERYPEECFAILRNYNYYRGMNSWKKWWKGRQLIKENNQIWSEMVINSVKEFLLETSSKTPKELLIDWNIPFKYFSVSNKKEKFLTIFEVLKDCNYLIDSENLGFTNFIYHTLNSITVRDEGTTSEFDTEFDTEMADEIIYLLLNLGRKARFQSLYSKDVYWKDIFIGSSECIFYYFGDEYNISALELLQKVKDRLSEVDKNKLLTQAFPEVEGITTNSFPLTANHKNESSELSKQILKDYWKVTIGLLKEVELAICSRK